MSAVRCFAQQGVAQGVAVKPKVKLVGHEKFQRHNPRSDKFPVHRFHHVEFWCSDATNTYKRFQHGLGMSLVAKSDQSTGNSTFASYVLQSHELVLAFTAPYSNAVHRPPALAAGTGSGAGPSGEAGWVACNSERGAVPLPHYDADFANQFIAKHSLAVRAMGVLVEDAREAYEISVANGAKGVLPPQELPGGQVVSEVIMYGDVVLRYVSGSPEKSFLGGYTPVDGPASKVKSFGLRRIDHAVHNVPFLAEAVEHIMGFTGFHEFSEFTAEDVGTVDSGLNSMVLANNNEYILMPINEPTFGTPRKSQIQTFLEQHDGPGLQHLALKTDDIFRTLREMQARSDCGGFEFMPRPSDQYYRDLPAKVGDTLTPEQLAECEELGILVDKDDKGVLLQIFTKPLGDRPTVFFEIIQRVGCMPSGAKAGEGQADVNGPACEPQAAGCGGFGKGNFGELFKRIEDYERTLNV